MQDTNRLEEGCSERRNGNWDFSSYDLSRDKEDLLAELYQWRAGELSHQKHTDGMGPSQLHLPRWFLVLCSLVTAGCIQVMHMFCENMGHVEEIYDLTHAYTEWLNDWFTAHKSVFYVILATHSLLIDGLVLYLVYSRGIKANTVRLHVALLLFYVGRTICQVCVKFPMPEKWLFEDPGVPSLSVSYAYANDFFVSGHVGFLTLCTCELSRRGPASSAALLRFVRPVSILTTCAMSVLVLVTRIHYFPDVFDGILWAIAAFKLSDVLSPIVDRFFGRLFRARGAYPTENDRAR